MEQLVARRAHNPKVGGSNPSPATKEPDLLSPELLTRISVWMNLLKRYAEYNPV